jgi:hypothetical protein
MKEILDYAGTVMDIRQEKKVRVLWEVAEYGKVSESEAETVISYENFTGTDG